MDKQIRFGEPAEEFNDTQNLLGEVFSEWQTSNTDYNSLEQVLAEAYYSVSCDYYLSAYLQYPLYRAKPDSDFLRPYFDLWRQGYGFTLDEDCLYLCKYSGLTLNQYGVASPCRTICTVCGFVALS